jgi:DNA invertase Pin-like site-specific DNA recombinase
MTAKATRFSDWPRADEPVDAGVAVPRPISGGGARWAAYLRANPGSRGTLHLQLDAIKRFAGTHGNEIHPDAVFLDIGSGLDATRPGLAALRAAIRADQYDAVVVFELSRLSRDLGQMRELLDEFRAYGVCLRHPRSSGPKRLRSLR